MVSQIIQRGYVERGWLGVQVQRVTPEIADSLGLKQAQGALVGEVTSGSPAAKAGLKSMDLITAYGGAPITSIHDLTRAVADTRPGASRDLKIRRNGAERTVTVRIEALESPSTASSLRESGADKTALNGGLGLEVAQDAQGLVITDIVPDSAAQEAGLRVGDRLLMIGDMRVLSAREAQDAVRAARARGRSAILVQVERDGVKHFVGVPVSHS